jgi:hypothetical protein
MALDKIFLPTFISSVDYEPTRVLPHLYFYNGMKDTNTYYVEYLNSGSVLTSGLSAFPYFDNYQGNNPTTSSRTLLFNNETAAYGEIPSQSLYSEYWSTYVDLLYNPYTRVFNCQAIIPLADYYKIELNDIVEWRGNYYHLRSLNDYNLSNGECSLQLLGPVIDDVISNVLPGDRCLFDFSIEDTLSTTKKITLIDKGADSGPGYAVYYSFDCNSYIFKENVVLPNVGDYVNISLPSNTVTCIKLVSLGICSNSVVHVVPGSLQGDFSFDFRQLDFN